MIPITGRLIDLLSPFVESFTLVVRHDLVEELLLRTGVVQVVVYDLLAEREMTAVLQLLEDIARHLDVPTSVTAAQLRDLAKKTDLQSLTDRLEEFSDDQASSSPKSDPGQGFQ